MSNTSAFEIQEEPAGAEVSMEDLDKIEADPNASDYRKFIAKVRKYGRQSAQGKDSLPNLVGEIALAVSRNAIDVNEKDADGKKVDHATNIFTIYTKEEGAKALHDRTALSKKVQISKLKQVITATSKFDSFPDVLERARTQVRPKMAGGSAKLKSPFDAYISLARAQIKKDNVALTDEEIEQAILRGEAEAPTVEKELTRAHKILGRLLTGEGKHGLRIDKNEDIYDTMEKMTHDLKDVIRTMNSEYDKPKQKKEGPEQEAEGDQENEVTSESNQPTEDPGQTAQREAQAAEAAQASGEGTQPFFDPSATSNQ